MVLSLAVGILGHTALAQNPGSSDWPETEARLTRQLASGDTEQKRSALFDIRNFQTEQASRLAIPALKDKNEIVRATAASSIIFLPRPEAVTALAHLLDDKSEFVRREAAYALGNVGSPDASSPLLRMLQKEKKFEVRNAAVIALGQTGDPAAVESLIRILKATPNEENEFLRRSAARSIGQIAQIIRIGKPRVLTPQNFLPDKYKDIESPAQTLSSNTNTVLSSAVGVLIKTLQNNTEADDTRREAAFSLGAIGDRSSLSILHANRNSPDPYLAEICKEALLKIERSK